eukprot:6221799-Amphidinium_carterae.1
MKNNVVSTSSLALSLRAHAHTCTSVQCQKAYVIRHRVDTLSFTLHSEFALLPRLVTCTSVQAPAHRNVAAPSLTDGVAAGRESPQRIAWCEQARLTALATRDGARGCASSCSTLCFGADVSLLRRLATTERKAETDIWQCDRQPPSVA